MMIQDAAEAFRDMFSGLGFKVGPLRVDECVRDVGHTEDWGAMLGYDGDSDADGWFGVYSGHGTLYCVLVLGSIGTTKVDLREPTSVEQLQSAAKWRLRLRRKASK